LDGKIKVQFYGLMRRRLQTAAVEVAGDDLTIMTLLSLAEEKTGKSFLNELLDQNQGLLTGTIILINGENIRLAQGLQTRVQAGDSVALFSPAGGG
jgi:molybdopterin converting factor small subunit